MIAPSSLRRAFLALHDENASQPLVTNTAQIIAGGGGQKATMVARTAVF
jgi:hypothetical protein